MPRKGTMSMAVVSVSIVIPAFNEAANLEVLLPRWIAYFDTILRDHSFEIWICDDHSSDNTPMFISSIKDKRINYIRLSRRSGSHTAIRAGLYKARGQMVLCMAADGQEDLSVLKEMIELTKKGFHLVWGVRKARIENPLIAIPSKVFYIILSTLVKNDQKIDLANADFYLLTRPVVNAINRCKERNTSLFGLLIWLGFKQGQVYYERKNRVHGNSKWNIQKRLRLASDWIIAFSGIPLRFMTILGVFFSVSALLYSFSIFVMAIMGFIVPGWAETVILILAIGGIQMLMIGILGSYVWRALDESRKRPLFFIENEISDSIQNE
jgi:glycosyltransferase involved in cell wall biosynthesis